MKLMQSIVGVMAILIGCGIGHGSIVEFTDKDEWFDAVGNVTTIDFTEYSHATTITDQYADQGVIVTSPAFIVESCFAFPNDCHGITNPMSTEDWWVEFTTPMHWFAVDHPGTMQFDFYHQGEFVATTSIFSGGGSTGNFAGIISDAPFDEVRLYKPIGYMARIDDMHFGAAPIPGDLTGNGTVGVPDLLVLINAWGACADCDDCPADLNGDCAVGAADLLILISNWG